MKFSIPATLAALAVTAAAKPHFLNSEYNITPGQSFTFTYDGCTAGCTIKLKNGPSGGLKDVGAPLTTSATGTSFTWSVPSSIPNDAYSFEIFANDVPNDPNYVGPYTFGSGTASSSGSASVTKTSTSASSSTPASSSTTTSGSSTSSGSSTTTSRSTSTSSSATTSGTTRPTNTNDSPKYKSPLAFVLVTVATLVYFN